MAVGNMAVINFPKQTDVTVLTFPGKNAVEIYFTDPADFTAFMSAIAEAQKTERERHEGAHTPVSPSVAHEFE